ncbi:hypothetical protein ACVIVC_003546 [Sinorhizobium meliloti]
MAWNEVMIPTTVPKRPMKGAAEPIVASEPSLASSASDSRASVTSIARSIRICRPIGARAPRSKLFFHSRMAETKIAPIPLVCLSERVR